MTLKVEGMMCGHCEARVKKALEEIDGVSLRRGEPRERNRCGNSLQRGTGRNPEKSSRGRRL